MLFRQWKDFVSFPLDPDRVRTRDERLDTSRAYRRERDGKYPHDHRPSPDRGLVIDLGVVLYDDDAFECMEVTDYGDVTIWTRDKVWHLFRKSTNRMEKLMFLSRHPPRP
jgi:hypothetical protein